MENIEQGPSMVQSTFVVWRVVAGASGREYVQQYLNESAAYARAANVEQLDGGVAVVLRQGV